MKRYRAAGGKESAWQTQAVKSAVQLFRGAFDREDSETGQTGTADTKAEEVQPES